MQQRGNRIRGHALNHRHIIGDSRSQFTDATLVEKCQRKLLQMGINLDSQVGNRPFANVGDEIALGEIEHHLQHKHAQQRNRHPIQNGGAGFRRNGIHQPANRKRQNQANPARHHQRQQRQRQLATIRFDIEKQTLPIKLLEAA